MPLFKFTPTVAFLASLDPWLVDSWWWALGSEPPSPPFNSPPPLITQFITTGSRLGVHSTGPPRPLCRQMRAEGWWPVAAKLHCRLLCTTRSLWRGHTGLICAYRRSVTQRVTHSHSVGRKAETRKGHAVYWILHSDDSIIWKVVLRNLTSSKFMF